MERGEESEVDGGALPEEILWVWVLVAEVLVDFQDRCEDFLGYGASFCLSGLGLVEVF